MSSAYRLLLVSPDRPLLARLSAFIEELGYKIDHANDAAAATSAVEARRHDFLIVDESMASAGKGELLRSLEDAAAGPLYALWLGDCKNARAVTAALVAGFDDFLSKPVSHGELLSRLRAGALRLEFEQRWRNQAVRDSQTSLPTGQALFGKLRRDLGRQGTGSTPISCVLLEIDHFSRFSARFGGRVAADLFASVAGELPSLAPAPAEWFRVEEGFAALLVDHSLAEAAGWAERLAKAVAAHEFQAVREPVRLTVSQGVAEWGAPDRDGAELIAHAASALRRARRLGGGATVRYDASLARQSSCPSDSVIAAGQQFVQAPARDFMAPCTVSLKKDDSAALAARLMHQGGHEVLPVVDSRGKLIGLVSTDTPWPVGDATAADVGELMLEQPPHRDEQTAFPALLEFFTQSNHAWLVITKSGRPTGLIGRDTLASLTAPLAREDFRASQPVSLSSDYLFCTPA